MLKRFAPPLLFMKVSLNQLLESPRLQQAMQKHFMAYKNQKADTVTFPAYVATQLLERGIEVEKIIDWQQQLKDFLVAEILEVKKHPDADRLKICTVKTQDHTQQIVCGATNVAVGLKVILAPLGTVIPLNGMIIKPNHIRGIESCGMLCSFDELGLSALTHEPGKNIATLPSSTPLDHKVADVLGLSDTIFHLDITPNRPDLLGTSGIAAELWSALGTGKMPLYQEEERPSLPSSINTLNRNIHITSDAMPFCHAFALEAFKGALNTQALKTMRSKLAAMELGTAYQASKAEGTFTSGLVAVDITNHICFLHARPLHAFDADKIEGSLTLRLAKKNESFKALNGQHYSLDGGELVCADDVSIIALPGVMGGLRTAVTDETTHFYIESALFDNKHISAVGRKFGLVTDALLRFERGVDPLSVERGLHHARKLFEKAGASQQGCYAWTHPSKLKQSQQKLTGRFEVKAFERLTGHPIAEVEMLDFFGRMGLQPTLTHQGMTVQIPPYRMDLREAFDEQNHCDQAILNAALTEELMRLQGPACIPSLNLPPPDVQTQSATLKQHFTEAPVALKTDHPAAPFYEVLRKARLQLARQGKHEMITWSFISKKHAEAFKTDKHFIPLANPLSPEMAYMRPSLLPGLLTVLQKHQARSIETQGGLFEVGHIYDAPSPLAQTPCASFVRSFDDAATYPSPLHTLKSEAEMFLTAFGLNPTTAMVGQQHAPFTLWGSGIPGSKDCLESLPFLHPGKAGVWKWHDKIIGFCGALHPLILKAFDLKDAVWVAHFDLQILTQAAHNRQRTDNANTEAAVRSPYQRLYRDFGVIGPQAIPAGQLETAMRQALGACLADVTLFDVFQDDHKLGSGKKSLAFRLTLQPLDAPASETWLDTQTTTVLQALEPLGFILRRDMQPLKKEDSQT